MVDDPADAGECRQRALRLLALRTHFASELERKLAQRGFEPATVEDTLAGLVDDGLIDDYAAGVEFVESRLRRKALGPVRLRAELSRRGLERGLVEQIVVDAYPEDEEEQARRALTAADGYDTAAAARRLGRLGFGSAVIGRLVEELRSRENQ